LAKGKAPKSSHYIVAHFNIGVNEDSLNTSFSSWRYAWFLDIGATCHMIFQREFEYFNDNVDGIVYFIDKSNLKPSGIDTFKLKLPKIPDFLLHDVLYILELQRNLFSRVQI